MISTLKIAELSSYKRILITGGAGFIGSNLIRFLLSNTYIKVFNIDKSPGITDYLTGYVDDFSKVIAKSNINNLYIVPSGVVPPNPSELLGSKKLAELIKKLEGEWDMVLFDSPPLVAVTDATMISKEIDKIIIVVKVGQTENTAFEHTINALKNVSAPIGGIILNAVTESHNYGYYYYYYQYYNYYGQDK